MMSIKDKNHNYTGDNDWPRQDNVEKVADRIYLGSYLWKDLTWKSSPVCHLAGFLALLSSEVSALLICLITLDRVLVLRFPFSRARFSNTTAHVACIGAWGVGVALAGTPLLPGISPRTESVYHSLGNTDLSAVTSSSSAELGENINKSVHILLGKSLEKNTFFPRKI